MLGSGSALGGVRVWQAGPFFIDTLELRFKRQIFMILIVDYIYQKGFLKIENFKFLDNPFKILITFCLGVIFSIEYSIYDFYIKNLTII